MSNRNKPKEPVYKFKGKCYLCGNPLEFETYSKEIAESLSNICFECHMKAD